MKTKTSASKLSILLNDDGFDDIVFEDSDRQRRKGKKKTLSKSKILRDIKVQDGSSSSRRVDWRQCIRAIVDYLDVFILNQRARRLAAPFLLIGLLLTAVIEVIQSHFSYNIIIFSVLGAATKFPSFPKDSVRPQLCISLFTLFSFFVDINQLITKFHSKNYIITIMVLVMLSKAFVFNGFLRNASAAPRIRKYLDRRLRLFCFPLKQPKRIMRDIRGRFLALGWLHLFAVVAYVGFLLVFVFYFDYSLLLLSEQSGKMLPIYLLIKSFTTLCIFLGILYDTDVVLALWYFGCLGFSVSFVRQYIVRKRIELKGWPLAFAYYGLRFYALSFCKLIDVLWGFYGWYLISSNFMNGFLRVEDSLKIFLTFLMYTMVVTDIWCPILFFSIRWLLKRHKMMRELKVLEVSDDSEIEEFELRDELEPMIEADSRKQRKLEDFHRKYIEEGFEGEPGTMKLAVTRKPSKADKVKVKGNRKLKENMIMPEISHTDRDYDVDPEGQVALDSVSTIEPGHVLDHPDDNYRPKRRFEAQNPLIQPESLYPAVAPRHQDEDDDSFQEYDDSKYNLDVELQEIARKIEGPSKRISPIEYAELWDLFSAKECKQKTSVMIKLAKYFLSCCELLDPRDFIVLTSKQMNSLLLKALTTHLSNVGIQVVTAGIFKQTELSLLVAKVVVNQGILLMEIKVDPCVPIQSTAKHVSMDYVVRCTARASSIDYSRVGIRLLQLDKMFEVMKA